MNKGQIEQKKEEKVDIHVNKVENDLKSKLEEYTTTLKLLQADFENYVKRTEKEKQEFTKYANHKVISKLLNLYDDFERAISAIKEDNEVKEGIKLIHKQFTKLLEDEGVKKMETVGKKFDPYKHEILDIVNGKEDDVVIEELQKGYLIHDKVLRTA